MIAQIISLKDKRKERGLVPEPTANSLTRVVTVTVTVFSPLAKLPSSVMQKSATIVAYPGGIDDLPI